MTQFCSDISVQIYRKPSILFCCCCLVMKPSTRMRVILKSMITIIISNREAVDGLGRCSA